MSPYGIVGIGGALGAVARYGLGLLWAGSGLHGGLPWNYLVTNVSGSYVIGLVMALTLGLERLSATTRLLLGTGLLGGYTTFSTFILGTYQLLWTHHAATGSLYALGSVTAGLTATWLGLATVRLAVRWREMAEDEKAS